MTTTQEEPANPGGDPRPPSAPSFRLRILSSDLEGLAGQEIASTRAPTIIGRADDCAVVLKDSRISRRHACIEAEGNGFRLADMGSANGIYVGNDRVVQLRLRHGLRFRIGGTEFEFVIPRPPA
jgi:pSer/pThr/pTyr-binding forkhead associated (FHA) protein